MLNYKCSMLKTCIFNFKIIVLTGIICITNVLNINIFNHHKKIISVFKFLKYIIHIIVVY
jgi:hypothetical protein